MRLAVDHEALRFMLDLPEGVTITGSEDGDGKILFSVEDPETLLGAPDQGDYEVIYRHDSELGIVVLDSLLSLP